MATEDSVVQVLEASFRGLTASDIRVELGLPVGKRSSNRISYLLKRLGSAGRIEESPGTAGFVQRNRVWRLSGPPATFPSALVVVSGEYDPLVVARATPRTAEAADRLEQVSQMANSIAEGYDTEVDFLGSAIRIRVGLIPNALDEPEKVPACVRRMLVLMEDIDFEVLDSHSMSLGPDYSMFFTIRCRPD